MIMLAATNASEGEGCKRRKVQLIDLNGRVAIVTGAGGGLGRAHARLLAQRGARVVVNDLGGGADSVTREVVEEGGEARAFLGSVTDAARCRKWLMRRWNAGIASTFS